ncbi:MAG TPA: hypothetical protein VM911_13555 [Pyrinomonadaceae bacterium]|jgi:hypothetical protein|nr:hypothetical protein [Pyrinomonadaceae bacterium]
MAIYGSEMTLLEARTKYFALNGFGVDGGYNDTWVRVEYGWMRFYFPNTRARASVVRYHDLHHILTGYSTTMPGETEISAWDIATGCTANYAAWILNLLGFGFGLLINRRGVYRSFMRGRYSLNLYVYPFDDRLLSSKVGEMRCLLGLDKQSIRAEEADKRAFMLWAGISFACLLATYALLLAPLVLLIVVFRLMG